MSELPKRLVIENKAQGPKYEKQFFMEIQAAIVDGYRLAENPYSVDCTMRNFMGHMGRAVLYLPGYEPLEGEPKGIARETSSLEDGSGEVTTEEEDVIIPEETVEPSEDAKEEGEGNTTETPEEIVEPSEEPVEESSEEDQEDEEKPEEDESSEDKEDELDSLTKKKELLAYAKKVEIEIPDNVTIPSQIKKYIKDNLDK